MTDTTPATLGHVALHYRDKEDGEKAARLLHLLGFATREALPLPDGTTFYHFLVDATATNNGDGILYLSPLRRAHRWLYDSIHEALGIGTDKEHPAVAKVRKSEMQDPEAGFHVGFLVPTLERIEEAFARVREAAEADSDFGRHVEIILNRAPPGTPDIDARLDASPLFRDATRHTYGRHGVQAFIRTDLLCSGPLGDDLVLEFDYVFPGYPDNMLTKTEM
ncbi:hypothetical protein [Novosphingobium naphthalenivorans]|uniref:hypothetical protein n=1 Tax=Novosphingobium naphthalenivorans TaxID=273168 RepID=UPI00082A89D0|nr:hypothetical protein [Novosphingobium naphthalenivorans]